jgi:CheY-like chemotaxis protein
MGLLKRFRKPLVLSVDDDPLVQVVISEALKGMGYRVLKAGNGQEGLALAQERLPALILLDMHMPIVDGKQALGFLKRDPRTKDIPVLMVTAEQMNADVEDSFKLGAAGYVLKPIVLDQFRRKVSETLPLP